MDLTPQFNRPLSPWNPLDYLRLLYWVFFFPQALPWYIHRFGNPGSQEQGKGRIKIADVLHRDPVQRRLVLQALALLLITLAIVVLGLSLIGKIDWLIVAVGAALGVISGAILGATLGIAFGVPYGITFGVTFAVVGNIIEIVLPKYGIASFGAVWGTALGAAAGMALNAAGSAKSGVDDDVMKGITGGIFFIVIGGIFLAASAVFSTIATNATFPILSKNLKNTAFFSIGLGAAFCLCYTRLLAYIPLALLAAVQRCLFRKRWAARAGRVVFLPLPGVRKQMEKDLESDWEKGSHHVQHTLAYTFQYIPLVKAVKNILERSSKDTLLSRVSVLVDRTWDWNLLRYCSSNLNKQFRKKAFFGFLFPFRREKKQTNEIVLVEDKAGKRKFPPGGKILRIDMPARAACAGFWCWHDGKTSEAVQAFAGVQDQRHGTELYYIAEALNKWYEISNDDDYKNKVGGIVEWAKNTRRLKNLPTAGLRPGTLAVLLKLQEVTKEIEVAVTALSPFKRSNIAKNAKAELNRFTAEGEEICPNPEWPIIKEIILKWLEILDKSEWEFPGEELRKPVENPYEGASKLPVTGPTFRGREDIIKKIEEHWAIDKNMSTLILYGQRRIGKTSILYNMARRTGSDILLVYISMQNIGKLNHTGQLLYRFAEAISRAAGEKGLPAGMPPDEGDYTDMYKGSRSFNHLLDKLAPHMTGQKRLVLAIDEFELIQNKIDNKEIDADILPYLRDMVQEYNWLGMILAGLHVIEEMGRDYKAAFFGQADYIRVSFLKRDDAFGLIAHPKPPRIALEYSQDLLDEFYRLTAGQPYLIQCLCGELVSHWNERFEQEGAETPRTLTVADLPQAITSDFFESAAYYFDGVWDSITENEHILMRIMAQRQEGTWTLDELADTVKNHPTLEKFSTLKETIDLLKRHDVILEEGGKVRFAGELMRRWVAKEKSG